MNENEYEITTQRKLHQNLPQGNESDWIEFASLPIISGKLRVSDPMFFRDLPPSPTFDVECGTYRVMAKIMSYPRDRRVSRLRSILRQPSSFGHRLDYVIVDFAQVGIFDAVVLDEAGEKLDVVESEKMAADLGTIQEFGIVQLGTDQLAIMPLTVSGFGDGGYPIHELLLDGRRVGVEVVFIGPEVLADWPAAETDRVSSWFERRVALADCKVFGEGDAVADKDLVQQIAGNLRINTRSVLRVLASPDEQRSYQAAVPFVHVPIELFCQWDAVFQPGCEAFDLAFQPRERAALEEFNAVFRRASAALPDPMPDLEDYIMSAAGAELARAAVVALRSLNDAQGSRERCQDPIWFSAFPRGSAAKAVMGVK
jgi:hypothetical protein